MTASWETPPAGAAAVLAASVAAAVPRLTTARLELRAPRIGDFEGYLRIAATERARFIGGAVGRAEAWRDFAEMCAGWLLRGHGLWSVERRADGSLLGFLPLHHEPGDPEPELGFLFLPEAEGQGYAFEAAEAARAFAFDRLGLAALVSYVDPANARSVRLTRRLGAVRDAAPHPAEPEVEVWRHVPPARSEEARP